MKKALENIRIIDLTRVLSGPYCTAMLADMGAEVIKIEHPNGMGDISRGIPGEDDGVSIKGESLYFMSLNRGKKSLTLDLKKEKSIEIFKKLIKKSDVVVDNFRPGVMDKLGLGYEELKKINDQIIVASISGFGQNSPLSQGAAYDIIAQAMGGIMSVTGQFGSPPTKVGSSLGDTSTALYTGFAIVSALYARKVHGVGQQIDVAMVDSIFSLLEWNLFKYLSNGVVAGRIGSRHPQSYPFDIFKASDGYFVIGTVSDVDFGRFCEAIDQPEIATAEDYCNDVRRGQNSVALKEIIEEWASCYSVDEIVEKMNKAKVGVSPVYNTKQIAESEHIKVRNMLVDINHPIAGKTRVVALPPKLSETPASINSPAPLLGQHTEEVLIDLLGYSQEFLEECKESGAI